MSYHPLTIAFGHDATRVVLEKDKTTGVWAIVPCDDSPPTPPPKPTYRRVEARSALTKELISQRFFELNSSRLHGPSTTWFVDDKGRQLHVKTKQSYFHGMKHGHFETWVKSPNGNDYQMESAYNYVHDKLFGPQREYYLENGQCSRLWHVTLGEIKHGCETRYATNGKVILSQTWFYGMLDGLVETFDDAGNPEKKVAMQQGVRYGQKLSYYKGTNVVKTKKHYCWGHLEGAFSKTWPNGMLREEGAFQDDDKVGKWIKYDETGLPIEISEYAALGIQDEIDRSLVYNAFITVDRVVNFD